MRNAYEENSILKTPSSNQNPNAAKQSLDLNLEDSHDQEDDVPSFSNDQDAISEESTLSAVTREMYNRHIRAVVVNATDVLDTIFVTQFLKRNLPNVRIVVSHADLIFARRGQAANFRGVLMVTPYPLIGNSVDWGGRFLVGANSERSGPYGTALPDRVFPTWQSVATYDAIRLLEMRPLQIKRDANHEVSAVKGYNGKPLDLWLFGYNDPFHGGDRPPLWLSTVGRGEFWPVALLDRVEDAPPSSLPLIFADNHVTPQPNSEGTIPPSMFKPGSRSRITALWLLLAFVLAGAFFCWSESEQRPQYRFYPENTNGERRAWIVLGIILCYSWIARLLMLDLSWRTFRGDAIDWCMVAIEAFLLYLAGWLILKALNTGWRPWAAALLLLFTVALQTAFHFIVLPAEFGGRVFYYYRAEHLFDEVSPILPFIFLFAAIIAVITRHIQALFYFSPALRPRIPIPPVANDDGNRLLSPDDESHIFQSCYSPWRLPRTSIAPPGLVPMLAIAVITGLIFGLCFRDGFDSMESTAYDICLTLFAAFVVFMLLYEVFWCFIVWNYLRRKLLVPLERTPLRACFNRVHGFSWRHLWFNMDMQWEARYKALSRAYESINGMNRDTRCPLNVRCSAKSVTQKRSEMFRSMENYVQRIQRFYEYQKSLCAHANIVIGSILISSSPQERPSTGLDDTSERKTKLLDPSATEDPLRACAEEFVGLLYIHAIQYVLVDIRSHVFAFAFGYFFLLLALDVYPVGPHHTIMLVLMTLFLVFFVTAAWMFQEMSRDSILSRTTNTEPGQLDLAFYAHLAAALAVPLMGLIASQFPEVSNFLYSWLQPSLQAIK